ncbi:hypothetical protein NQ317_012022 [Molorchus minor]|uniref:Uncharacterized protein n=1 Tax=Molorchus minor TaxID=1323400 RepID=A0ABQ9K0A7_9CUCU|nr:hypothetical protein NQ317_012022 [Molorchus minor]
MFALWYGVLTYREYREVIWNRFFGNRRPAIAARETAVVSPLPAVKPEPSKIPVVQPSTSEKPPSPRPLRTPSPQTPDSSFGNPQAASTPKGSPEAPKSLEPPAKPPRSPDASKSLEPPAKPPRSPSPHPIKAETLDDIEYEEEEDEEEEEEENSDAEEDDENSVIASTPRRVPISASVNEFINQEISMNQPNALRLNQTR